MRISPVTLKEANNLVASIHRHHKPTVGHKFSVGVRDENGKLLGAAICGRPVARMIDHTKVIEVNRLVTDGTPNACSMLYSACRRIAKEMGYKKIITYILESESGTSLKASNWKYAYTTAGGSWNHPSRPREDKAPICKKQLWECEL